MTVEAMFNLKCDGCSNVPGFLYGFDTEAKAKADARGKNWQVGVIDAWTLERRDLCPYCICQWCTGSRAVPDWSMKNAYGEPTPIRCPECSND